MGKKNNLVKTMWIVAFNPNSQLIQAHSKENAHVVFLIKWVFRDEGLIPQFNVWPSNIEYIAMV